MENHSNENSQLLKLLAESNEKDEGGDLQTAIAFAQQALAESEKANALFVIPKAQIQMARLLSRNGQYHEARDLALKTLQTETGSSLAADAWNILGVCASETNDPVKGEEHFHRSANLSRSIQYPTGLARALHNLATSIYLPQGKFDLALTVMEESQQLRTKIGKPHWGLPFLQAYISVSTGNRKRAHQALDELLPHVQPATRVAGFYFYLWTRVALDEEELDKAEEYLHLLLRIASTTGSPDLNIWARLEYSQFYRLKGAPASARSWAEEGLGYARRVGYAFLVGEALIEVAQTNWESDDPQTAVQKLQEAEDILTPLASSYDLARIAFLRANWYHQQKRPEAETAWLEAARAITLGGYTFILERERDTAFPMMAAYLRSRSPAARAAAEGLLQSLTRVAPPLLKINGLGEFTVWQGRRQIPEQQWQRRKAGELFRFLLLQPSRAAGREMILDALWPDSAPQAGLDQLHQATSALRHVLEPDLPDKFPSRYLSVEGERVSLRLPEGSSIDFDEFERLLPGALQADKPEKLQKVLEMYHGDLFHLDQYSDWSAVRREHLFDLYQRGLLALGQAYLEIEQFFEAVNCSRMILQRDPWSEDAVKLGMQSFEGLRDAPHAIQLFQNLEKVLREELDLSPRADLRELADRIRVER